MAKILNVQEFYNGLITKIKTDLKLLPGLCLASVAIGKHPSSSAYLHSQEKLAQELGIKYRFCELKEHISLGEFKSEIKVLNQDKSVTGIIINKPFPFPEEEEVFSLIDPDKDVEGVHPFNLGKLFFGSKCISDNLFLPPTVKSVLVLLSLSGYAGPGQLRGKKITIVGFSALIGKPLALLLANELATVSIAHIGTFEKGDLAGYVGAADILISAVGKPELIKGEWVKEGSVLIDVGIGKKDGKTSGDIEFAKAKDKASFITPVPGGVGKLTPIFLYSNLVLAAKKQR